MRIHNFSLLFVACIAIVLNSGCSKSSSVQTISEPAQIEGIEIVILESFPVQVHVRIYSLLPDSCTEPGYISQRREGNEFLILVSTIRPVKAVCADVIAPLEQVAELDVYGLLAGSYIVDVNGVRETFTLDRENRL